MMRWWAPGLHHYRFFSIYLPHVLSQVGCFCPIGQAQLSSTKHTKDMKGESFIYDFE